jgi:hypothetical protein
MVVADARDWAHFLSYPALDRSILATTACCQSCAAVVRRILQFWGGWPGGSGGNPTATVGLSCCEADFAFHLHLMRPKLQRPSRRLSFILPPLVLPFERFSLARCKEAAGGSTCHFEQFDSPTRDSALMIRGRLSVQLRAPPRGFHALG